MRTRTGEANLITAALCFVIAALLVFAAAKQDNWPGWLRLFLALAGIIIAVLGAALAAAGVDQLWARHELDRARVDAAKSRAMPEVARIEAYTALVARLQGADETVLRILQADPLLAKVIAGNFGPVTGVSTAGGYVPYEFLDEWWAKNKDNDDLLPVTWWDVAGHKRQYASWLENHLIQVKLLEKWGGQRTARWAYPKAKADFVKYFYGERIRQLQVRTVEESEAT